MADTPSPRNPTVAQPTAKIEWQPTGWDKLSGWFLNPNYAQRKGIDFSGDSAWKKVGRFSLNLGLFMAGFVASAAWHEFGHFVFAEATGTLFVWPASGWDGILMPLWGIPEDTPTGTRIAIALGGFIFDGAGTEAILWMPWIPKDNVFVCGFLAHSIFNNMFYPLTDVIKGGYGDINAVRVGGGSVVAVHVVLLAHSILALARLVLLHKEFRGRFNAWEQRIQVGPGYLSVRW